MAVTDFYIKPGLEGAFTGLAQAYNYGQDREAQQAQLAQQQQEKEQMRALSMQAATGDTDAIEQLWGLSPELAQGFEQREAKKVADMGAIQAQESKKAETDWGIRWKQAAPEQKEALLQEALDNPLIDIDEDDVGVEGPQADLAVNTMLYGHLGKDGFKNLGLSAPEPISEYQQAMIEGASADREIRKAEAENKRIDNQIKRETSAVKLEELRNKKQANEEKQFQIKKARSDAAQTVVDSGTSTLDLISEIEGHPGFESAIGAKGASSLYGMLDDPIAGTDAAGVVALIETLEAQNFLTAIGEFKSAGGAGSLSDNEGKKLGAALSNLKRSQSETDFKKSLNVIKNLVKKQVSKASPQIEDRFTLDQTQGDQVTDTLSDADLLKKYGGQ